MFRVTLLFCLLFAAASIAYQPPPTGQPETVTTRQGESHSFKKLTFSYSTIPGERRKQVTGFTITQPSGNAYTSGPEQLNPDNAQNNGNGNMPEVKWMLGVFVANEKRGMMVTGFTPGTKMNRMRPLQGGNMANPTIFAMDPQDIIVAVDGIATKNRKDLVFAINNASTPEDIPIVVIDRNTGKAWQYYVSAIPFVGP